MKQRWKRMSLILMAIAIGMSLSGCFISPKNTARRFQAGLEAKYGEEFHVISMGGRNAGNMDIIQAHCYPEANEEIVFNAQMDTSGTIVRDGYVSAYVTNEVEQYIKGLFEAEGLEVQINFSASGTDIGELYNLDLSDENLLDTAMGYDISWGGTIAVRDIGDMEEMANKIYKVMNELWQNYPQIREWSKVFVIADEDFDACVVEMKKEDTISNSFFLHYGVEGESTVNINKTVDDVLVEGVYKTEEEILQNLLEEFTDYYH